VYARFPFFNEMNNRDLFGELMLRPTKALTLRSDVHGLWLANRTISGIPAAARFSRGPSVSTAARPTAPRVWLRFTTSARITNGRAALATGLYFGYARGGAVVEHIFPGDSNGTLGFVEVNYRF
jgi:hypothetical protein